MTSTAEDHCDVIPFLRACWRKKLFPAKDLLFVHFDAHPDLAVPSTTSVEVSDIKIKKNRGQRNEQKKIGKNRNKLKRTPKNGKTLNENDSGHSNSFFR